VWMAREKNAGGRGRGREKRKDQEITKRGDAKTWCKELIKKKRESTAREKTSTTAGKRYAVKGEGTGGGRTQKGTGGGTDRKGTA